MRRKPNEILIGSPRMRERAIGEQQIAVWREGLEANCAPDYIQKMSLEVGVDGVESADTWGGVRELRYSC